MTEPTQDQMTDAANERVTGSVHDQISAFIDDELSTEQVSFLVRRFERDPDSRKQLLRYTTIGCALRRELLQPDPAILLRRIEAALNGSTTQRQVARAPLGAAWRTKFARPLLGLGIAASVAVAAVVVLQTMNESRIEPSTPVAVNFVQVQPRQWTEPASYVVPQDLVQIRPVAVPIRLTNYLVHHGEYASRLSRTSVHSNVVGAAESLPEDEAQPLE